MNYLEQLRKQDISINTSGDNTVITIGAGEMPTTWGDPTTYIAIDHINLLATGGVTVQMKNGTAAEGQTNYGGAYPLVNGQGITLENVIKNEHGIITLKPNHSFVINLNGAVSVVGFIRYRLVGTE
jgi:hypothetical protein